MKKEIKITVRELIQKVYASGDLISGFQSSARPVDAIRIHQQIQKSRPETYQSEYPVSCRIETEKLVVLIGGRIDGVYKDSDPIVIEEIKTTARDLKSLEGDPDPHHWGQAKCYAHLYILDNNINAVDIQLTYCQIYTNEIREFMCSFTASELEEYFKDLLTRYLEWAERIADWELIRDESIRNISFPYASFRPGQQKMVEGVFNTIKDDGQLFIQASAGIGKTMGVIFPSIKAIGKGLNRKIFFLTARTTGKTAAEKAVDDLRRNGLRIKRLTLTAKDKVCLSPGSACHPDECDYARGYFDRINDALEDIFQFDLFDREVIEKKALEFQICPFEFSLDIALWADFIICDYNYAFDPRVYLRRFFQNRDRDYIFLVDEAHNLAERSRDMFSAEIFKQTILDVRRTLKSDLPRIYKSLGKINSWLVKAKVKIKESGVSYAEEHPPEELYGLLREFLDLSEHWLIFNIKTSFREDLMTLFSKINIFLKVSELYNDRYSTCYEGIGRDLRVKLFCIDPSYHLRIALRRCKAVIFFSATLIPLPYFKDILGCADGADHLSFSSPFPKENLGIFFLEGVSTLYRHRSQTRSKIANAILGLVRHKKGNYLLFFPSYEYMRMVYELFSLECREFKTIIQSQGMIESERDDFLGNFSHENPNTLIGFVTMGGIFGEGIDLVGERLTGVVIIGIGLPPVSLERELIRTYFDGTMESGFEYAYIYPGISRVLQAAGRVIRSEDDRGIILLVDQRFGIHPYRSLLPSEWDIVRVKDIKQLGNSLQRFWNH